MIDFLKVAARTPLHWITFNSSVSDACTKHEDLGEDVWVIEADGVILYKIIIEAVDAIVHDEVDGERFWNYIYIYWHNEQILRLLFYLQSYEKYMRESPWKANYLPVS